MVTVEDAVRVGQVLDGASGVLFLLLGLAMLLPRPRRAVNLAFAGFAAGFGLRYMVANASTPFLAWLDSPPTQWIAYLVGRTLYLAGAVGLAFLYPSALAKGRRRILVPPMLAAAGIGAVATAVFAFYTVPRGYALPYGMPDGLEWLQYPLFRLSGIADDFLLLCLAARYAAAPADARSRRQIVTVTWALAIYLYIANGVFSAQATSGDWGLSLLQDSVAMGAFAAFWIRNAGLRRGADRTTCLALAVAPFVLFAFGFGFAFATNVAAANNLGLLGLARIVGFGILAYAILKQQLFDIDIKVKWTLSRGTVAAVFLAVFFVFAQLGQNFLSDRYGWATGGVVAGLMLFAIAPIQRAAERLSDKAMPDVRPDDPKYILAKKRETYGNAYATAWADGNMTPKDVRMLHQVREALGLPAKDIVAIEKDWAQSAPKA